MPTQKLILLLLLVATLGGSAIWYMRTQINYDMSDEVYSDGVPAHSDNDTKNDIPAGKSPVTAGTPVPAKVSAPVAADPQAATAVAADVSAIAAAADVAYDDSALSSEFTTADANTLTNAYDN